MTCSGGTLAIGVMSGPLWAMVAEWHWALHLGSRVASSPVSAICMLVISKGRSAIKKHAPKLSDLGCSIS